MGAQEERSVFDRSVNNSWPPITGGGKAGRMGSEAHGGSVWSCQFVECLSFH